MRVDELFSFRRPLQLFLLKCIGYQGKEGIWVVAVAFRLGAVSDRQLRTLGRDDGRLVTARRKTLATSRGQGVLSFSVGEAGSTWSTDRVLKVNDRRRHGCVLIGDSPTDRGLKTVAATGDHRAKEQCVPEEGQTHFSSEDYEKMSQSPAVLG